jgi:signal transduction histidine kinase
MVVQRRSLRPTLRERTVFVMLDTFIAANRETIIAGARARVASRTYPKPTHVELTSGIPVFLDQLCVALRFAKSNAKVDHEELSKTAAAHGEDLLRLGLSVAQVVRDYRDVCQVVTQLAIDQKTEIGADEFQTLNLCLDDAVANAVTAYTGRRQRADHAEDTERLGVLAHEMRNLLNTASLSLDLIKRGQVAISGSTGLVLDRSLAGLRNLLDRSIAEVRLEAGISRMDRISVVDFIEDVEVGALIHARSRGVRLDVKSVDRSVAIKGDQQILEAALSNLLQNAFKFTPENGLVSLIASATPNRVLFDVQDECGGLPKGNPEDLFRPFEQQGADRTGIGLGLAICRKAAEANGGVIHARDLPGKGCVFTMDLPRLIST